MPNKRRRLDKEESHIVIVGSGLAGLSAAISLEQAGFRNVSVYERDASFEQQKEGYGLTLTYNPKGPLASLGLLEKVANEDCPSRSHYLFRSDGSIMGYFGNAFSKTRGLGQRGNLRVPRKVLRRMLFQKLSATRVHWSHSLLDFAWKEDANQYTVRFQRKQKEGDVSQESGIAAVNADLLVAADGIRSAVLQNLGPTAHTKPMANPHVGLRPIGIRLILGIAEFTHPLLTERGFYTLDGKHRLFTMPYESNRFESTISNRIMWQLSFLTDGIDLEDKENSDVERKVLDPATLQEYVLGVCSKWHNPVEEMVQATPLEAVWGTDLMDRDPIQVQKLVKEQGAQRLVVVGDALHSMSPFKGQGANQALKDGPLLAHWLQAASIDSAVTSFWREIVQRTATVVAASRKAARELHSPAIMNDSHGFAGVKSDCKEGFLKILQEKRIGAELGSQLDKEVGTIILSMGIAGSEKETTVCETQQQKALHLATTGDIQGLRQLTLDKHSASIRTAKNDNGQSCLHLAAIGGHAIVCRWLLTEVECDIQSKDHEGKRPVDYSENGTPTVSVFRYI
ncbi:unnamed protein product [Cylindrotheca closterium]|uniref:FAD-binding domain-containing protein n=1 Tax=Cylindrotheca closterium TaxID=2856 RepID=A0AAD2PUV3_9STRA|nr:unnamed protein product [Cylindrotheca closterium]